MTIKDKKTEDKPGAIETLLGGLLGLVLLFLVAGTVSVLLGGLFAFCWNHAGFLLKFTWLQATWTFMALACISAQFGFFSTVLNSIVKSSAIAPAPNEEGLEE